MIRTWIISFLTLSIVIIAFFSSCEKLPSPGDSPPDEITESDYSIQINSQNKMQKITQWGHDIKQTGKAKNLTEAASRQIFQNGNFNLLRIPIYALAHNADGSVRKDYMITMVSEDNRDEETQWEKIPASDDWFYLKSKAHDKYIKGWDDDTIEMAPTSNQGAWTQWKFIDAGNGWYYIKNKGLQKYIRERNLNNEIHLTDTTNQGTWTQWKLIDAGNGYYYIKNNGHNNYLKGGGNAYQPIIDAVTRAKNNGDPDLFASHKMYTWDDFRTYHNLNFGPFYTKDGIDASGFAAAIDAFIEYIYAQTGKTVKYAAPKNELGNYWTADKYVEVVNKLTASPLIVGPEASLAKNSERLWAEGYAEVTDIKATHNKMKAKEWPADAEYDWNGETTGGVGEEFPRFFRELNMSFYVGKVEGVIFWGDNHLRNTDDRNSTGPFRRELVEASSYNLVESDVASYDDGAAAIAFETGEENGIKVFYNAVGTVEFTFDKPFDPASIPEEASVIGPKSFIVNATGKTDYRSFTLSFRGK